MLRRLVTAASVISLLLFAAAVALWAVSQFRGCSADYIGARWWDARGVVSTGKLMVTYNSFTPPLVPPYRRLSRHGPLTPTPPLLPPRRRWILGSGEPAYFPFNNYTRGMQPLVTLPWAGLLQKHFDADQYIEGVGTRTGHGTYYLFWTRLEPVAILLGILPAWRAVAGVRRYRRTRRQRTGHCPICGYNLAGNVSGICPECGKDIMTLASVKSDELKKIAAIGPRKNK